MVLTWEKVQGLWQRVREIRALFSDLTQNDFSNFFQALTHQNSLWFEIWDDEELSGIVWLADTHLVIDAVAHMMFLDSRPAEKKPVVRELIRWVFEHYPLQRMTAFVPEPYHATKRLTESLGFQYEGQKRDAVMLSGRLHNLWMYGLTRRRLEGY
jgi:hypothetical protein